MPSVLAFPSVLRLIECVTNFVLNIGREALKIPKRTPDPFDWLDALLFNHMSVLT